jgi:hypothetical protein
MGREGDVYVGSEIGALKFAGLCFCCILGKNA